ncbi:hypothetical protein D3C80_2050940 [compost metagenome]
MRKRGSLGRNSLPSARKLRMALDSHRYVPSSNSSTGTLPLGFIAKNSGVSVSPLRISTECHSYGRPSRLNISLTL